MTLRAYVSLSGLKIEKYPKGSNYIVVMVDGGEAIQAVTYESGEWFVVLNAQRPRLPKELRGRVRAVTSHEESYRTEAPFKDVSPGRFASRSGNATATVTHFHCGNPHVGRVSIDIVARSIPALLAMRNRLLFGKTQRLAA